MLIFKPSHRLWCSVWPVLSLNPSTRFMANTLSIAGGLAVVSADRVPDPQPAAPPTPAFDESEPDHAHFGGPAPPPSPATPPTSKYMPLSSQSGQQHAQSSPISSRPPFNGTEYRLKRLVIRPAELKVEGVLLVAMVIYALISYHGKRKNQNSVSLWLNSHAEFLSKEFSQVGTGSPKGYSANGPAQFYGYATGRKGCKSLNIRFCLRPRQDIPFMIYEEIRAAIDFGWTGKSDRLELAWDLSPINQQNTFDVKDYFVWALVEKRVMNSIRQERWDVGTFTELKESSLLPSQLVFMSESGEITDQISKSRALGFSELLKSHPSSLSWFDSLVLSGTPSSQPPLSQLPLPSTPIKRTLTLRLRLPTRDHMLDSLPLIQFCFNLIDSLDRAISLTPVLINKLMRRRTEVCNLILDETRKEEERIKEEERRKKLKSAQDEKIAKMSASEQKKHDERERKRNATKMGKIAMKHR
ncbi:hypothetical protein O181_056611 [Austropuccinia psidii MF-1]|uniref:Coiled-coil domain-containing protein 47 n=1 Tax=Austropuccinia psidii MF-1 TaxID=1389203 RepID=A0A9Q3HT51_9BASI|nr:hypothetical protein [Austropuccinia psidii MF-1]